MSRGKKISLSKFLELAHDEIDKQVTKDMEKIFPYSNASHIINYTEGYKNGLIDVYDNCGGELSKTDAVEVIKEYFRISNLVKDDRQLL